MAGLEPQKARRREGCDPVQSVRMEENVKREFVRELIPDISKEALDAIMEENGKDIERQKAATATLAAERDNYRERLEAASQKLEGYDPEWRAKAAQAQRDADAKIAALEYDHAATTAAGGLRFTSESAQRAFLADLKTKGLPVQDGKLMGFDDYVKAYRESDPNAFQSDTPPRFTGSTPGKPAEQTDRDKVNAAFRAAFGKE